MTEFKAPPVPPQPYNENQSNPVNSSAEPVVQSNPTDNVAPAPTEPAPESPVDSQSSQSATNTDALHENLNKLKQKVEILRQQFDTLPQSKRNLILYVSVFVVGLLMGWAFFGGSSKPSAPVVKGLQGVVSNPDIKEKLQRCGMVSPSSPCVLYVMNNYHYDKIAKDFFEMAVTLTQRPDFLIQSENVRYGTVRIPPGYFAEIKIPMKR